MRAAIYVCLSRETGESTSPERQRAACEALCQARGLGRRRSGRRQRHLRLFPGPGRPGLQRVLSRLAEFDVIVFFKIDCLARSTVDFAVIMKIAQSENRADCPPGISNLLGLPRHRPCRPRMTKCCGHFRR
ncbi:recombinase family protein [Streptomyces shenzhenensis]|uniref:recombinase family protein n=1 Tax=Streptomyces shenzhenensis TaxID=943815 RepID=UPI0033FE2F78